MRSQYKIVVADDHSLVIDGLISILESEEKYDVVATAKNYRELNSELRNQTVDVLITDLNMPGLNGIEMITEIKTNFPLLKVIVLSMYEQNSIIQQLKKLEISGYLLKHNKSESIKTNLEDIIQFGKSIFPRHINSEGVDEIDKFKDSFKASQNLGKREIEVLKLVGAGHSNHEIAEQMFLSIETIYSHRKHIRAKLELKNNGELAAFAVKYNLYNGIN